ncbi:MAG TPA: LysR substrate-binding domain-containing protein, partial [Dongiaceae bacterium]|nr:LysR substrate-binding domain-containing protein [Dongiaceae bacterium]
RSFRRAAAQLAVSPAAVSKAVQTLEASLKVQLLARDARNVSLTPEGALFFERARAAVAEVTGAREALEPVGRVPEGQLVVSLPFVLTGLVARGLALLRARHPKLTFAVAVTDQLSRLGAEPIDVAVRVGRLAESRLIARTLRQTQLLTVASPAYLARRGRPTRLDELAEHDCLGLVAPNGKPHPWWFKSGPRPIASVIDLQHGPMLFDAVLAGMGISQVFDFMAAERLRSGELVQLFAPETAAGPEIHAVCAPGRRATPRVRAAFEAFADAFSRATLG